MNQRLQRRTRNAIYVLIGISAICVAVLMTRKPEPTPESTPVASPAVVNQPAIKQEAPPPSAAHDNATMVLELFNPSDQSLTHQLNETTISQQIEQIMATSDVLANCNLISKDDYRDSFRALIVYAQQMKLARTGAEAEAKVRQIAQSAGVSYSLVYSRTACTDAQLPPLVHQLLTWQHAYLNQ